MGLAAIDTRKPVWQIEAIAGPETLRSKLLESTLIKFQYISRKGKGQVPKITMEFDNSTGLVFNPLILAVGLKLRVSFGYDGYMSKVFEAPVKSVKANCMVDSGRQPMSPRPDTYGTVVMEMHLHKSKTHLHPEQDTFNSTGPARLSDIARRLARDAGYQDKQIFIQKGLGITGSDDSDEPKENLASIPEGETLMQYLRRKAVERGFYLSVTEDEFRFHRSNWKMRPKDIISYFMGPDVLSFSVEGDYALNTGKVKGKAYDPLFGYVVNSMAQPIGVLSFNHLPIKGKGGGGGTSDKPPEVVDPKDFVTTISSKLAEKVAKRVYNAATSRWAIKLVVVGNPILFENDGVVLDNFGPVVDGMWTIDEIEHRIDGDGYTTSMTLKNKAKGPGGPTKWVYVVGPNGEVIGVYSERAGRFKQDKHGATSAPRQRTGGAKPYVTPGRRLMPKGYSPARHGQMSGPVVGRRGR